MILPSFVLSEPLAFHLPALAAWIENFRDLKHPFEMITEVRVKRPDEQDIKQDAGSFFYNGRKPYSVKDGIAEIHVNDALSGNLTKAQKYVGMTDYGDLMAELEMAAADPGVKGVLLDINSPGGSAVGAPEAGAAVAAVREVKPIVSNIGRLGASAAIFLSAASNAIVASPSAIVGSIGTIMTHMEISGLLERFGVKVNIITPEASDLKANGNMFRTMTPKEREFLQGAVERMNADFRGWVSKYRSGAKEDSMRGQWFTGAEAMERGLVDYVGNKQRALAELRALIG